MKFRPVREFLSEAMEEVVEMPATKKALAAHLEKKFGDIPSPFKFPIKEDEITIEYQGFDDRIKWDSHLVLVNGLPYGYIDTMLPHPLVED